MVKYHGENGKQHRWATALPEEQCKTVRDVLSENDMDPERVMEATLNCRVC